MSNERDQSIVRAAVSDAAASLLSFVPSLGPREVFAFGEAVKVPTRLRFKELPAEARPTSDAMNSANGDFAQTVDQKFLDTVVDRWRGALLNPRVRGESGSESASSDGSAAAAERRGEVDRYRHLKNGARATP
jgi:hypothetical protein